MSHYDFLGILFILYKAEIQRIPVNVNHPLALLARNLTIRFGLRNEYINKIFAIKKRKTLRSLGLAWARYNKYMRCRWARYRLRGKY